MDTTLAIALVVGALLVGAGAAWVAAGRRRREKLRHRFGPEYEHAVAQAGSRRRAEHELESRQERVERIRIRDLSREDRARFAEMWRGVQTQFVDDPIVATAQADQLVATVMSARGYPVGDFEQRAADISVDHPRVTEHYRAAHAIAMRSGRGEATTEDRRQAMIHYRALFVELLEASPTEVMESRHDPP